MLATQAWGSEFNIQHPCLKKKRLHALASHCNPSSRESRQENSWGSLDNQSSWFRELWVQWETLSQKSDGAQLRQETNITLCPLCVNTHVHMNICTHTQNKQINKQITCLASSNHSSYWAWLHAVALPAIFSMPRSCYLRSLCVFSPLLVHQQSKAAPTCSSYFAAAWGNFIFKELFTYSWTVP